MKILIDADACPVMDITLKIAKKYKIDVVMYVDTSHLLSYTDCKIVIVDKSDNSVDFAIIKDAREGDIVVTQDYGLASLLLPKNIIPIHQNGFVYSEENINVLLLNRYISQEQRRTGLRTKPFKKRKKSDNINFESCLRKVIESTLKK